MPPAEVATLWAAPHMTAVAEAIAACAMGDDGGAERRGAHTGLYRQYNPWLPNAAGAWRFDPTGDSGSVVTHPLALVDDAVRTALTDETGAAADAGAAAAPAATVHSWSTEASLPLATALIRELEEELGIVLPPARFEWLFTHVERLESVQRGARFVNNEFNRSAPAIIIDSVPFA